MGTITYERIKISGGLGMAEVKELELSIEANCHATARLTGRVEKNKYLEASKESLEKHVTEIFILEEDGSEPLQPIFSGYPKKVTFTEEGDYYYLNLELISGTILLDREKKSRSFQDVSRNYGEIIKKAITDIKGANVICLLGSETKPIMPLIQYMETTWEFIERLASHLGACVYPEVRQALPRFWFGMPETGKKADFSQAAYEIGISRRFYELGGQEAGLKQADFLYYRIPSTLDFNIGDTAVFDGRTLKICKKKAFLTRGELKFTYVLGTSSLVALRRKYNPVFAGMSIMGKVLSAQGETVKLHLDIDKEQDSGTAYAYDWKPDTGSVMYCMPQAGTTVSLYFSNEEESSARAVNCIRTNGDSCPAMADSSKKTLNTEHGKQLYLGQTSLGFIAEQSGVQLKMEDDVSILLESSKKISIAALGKVMFKGKKISVQSPVEMKLYRKK
jgi:hypothetical protein